MNSVEKNHKFVINKLNKRQQKRQNEIEEVKSQKQVLNAKDEGLEYFNEVFVEKKQEIANLLSLSNDVNTSELPLHFSEIGKKIQDLQKYVTSSTFFLTEFKIRHCQEALGALQTLKQDIESDLLPKKKFGFKNKNKVGNVTLPVQNNGVDSTDARTDNPKIDFPGNTVPVMYDANVCDLQGKKNETLTLHSDEIKKKDVSLHTLTNCIIFLKGTPCTLHMNNLNNCTILSGPVSTSVFTDNCHNCTFVLACQQLRLHSSTHCDVYLHVTGRAILEDCKDIQMAPYNWTYENIQNDFVNSGLDCRINNWSDVGDFNWLANEQSPNWSIMAEELRTFNWDSILSNK